VTVPPIAPVTVDWPKAIALIPRISERTKESFTNFDIAGELLKHEITLKDGATDRSQAGS
jgi:hypothetical protein